VRRVCVGDGSALDVRMQKIERKREFIFMFIFRVLVSPITKMNGTDKGRGDWAESDGVIEVS